jgi:glutamate carboxypeptidase
VPRLIRARAAVAALAVLFTASAFAAANEPVLSRVKQERAPLLDTLKQLVEIESGSSDIEGLDRIRDVIAKRFTALGAKVDIIDPEAPAPGVGIPKQIGKIVKATFTGTGKAKILLLAHMDTVYPRGMLEKQPFKVEADKAWGLGIADDRHGVALTLHAMKILGAMAFKDYGTVTVLIDADEEISSVGSRNIIVREGAAHDAVMSFEGGGFPTSQVRLATAGTSAAVLKVTGRASHAGAAPERGVNALYELSHQILQLRDLSNPQTGLKVNWTVSKAGVVRNMIPPTAEAIADIRVERVADLDAVEQALRDRIKKKLLPESQVELDFIRGRPPLQANDANRKLAAHAAQIYSELGRKLTVRERSTGGATDAAYAQLKSKAAVVEGFGLQGFGSHSTNAEYIVLDSIEPRLYLATRMIMDIAQAKAQ